MRIGIDLGGTKIEAIALMPDGTVLPAVARRRRKATIAASCDDRRSRPRFGEAVSAPGTIGIGTPGSLSPRTGLIRNSNRRS